ncbi:MAG: RsbRD N-terminal domain-containing protein, partial [Nitrospirae bacterium]|nr:RsbRD N-terminal domain-containing protein [Nitrospirota bacterium]
MNLHDILVKERNNLLNGWFTLIIQTYPPESKAFLEKKNEPFSNPIGHSILVSIEGVLEELLNNMVQERIIVLLNDMIRVRAVQDCNPSEAISFIFLLKQALRSVTKSYIKGDQLVKEISAFEDTIDKLSLISFDIFMKCREDIFNLRVNEMKRST